MKWSPPLSLFLLLAPHVATARIFDRRQESSDATRTVIEARTPTVTMDTASAPQPTALTSWSGFSYTVPECAQKCVLNVAGKDVEENPVAACEKLSDQTLKNFIYGCVDTPTNCKKGTNSTEFNKNVEDYCVRARSGASSLKLASTSSKKTTEPTSSSSARTTTRSGTSDTASRTTPSATLAPASIVEPSREGRKEGPSGGAIAGMVMGILAFLALLGLIAWLMLRKRRNPREQARSMSLEPPSSSSPRLIGGPIRPDPSAGWAPMGSTATTPTSWCGFESRSQHSLPASSVSMGEMRQQERAPSSLSFGVTVSEVQQQQPYSTRNSTPGPAPSTHSFGDAGPYAVPAGSKAIRSSGLVPSLKIDPSPPVFNYTPASPDDHEPPSPVSPVTPYAPKRSNTGHESFSSSIVSDDDGPPMPLSGRFSTEPFQQRSASRAISPPSQVSPMTPPPHVTSASPTPPGALSRADSVSWRREIEEAAARAANRVVVSEQEYAEERRESKSQSAFAKLTRRWSDRDELDGHGSKQRPVSGSSATSSVKARRKSGVMIV